MGELPRPQAVTTTGVRRKELDTRPFSRQGDAGPIATFAGPDLPIAPPSIAGFLGFRGSIHALHAKG